MVSEKLTEDGANKMNSLPMVRIVTQAEARSTHNDGALTPQVFSKRAPPYVLVGLKSKKCIKFGCEGV